MTKRCLRCRRLTKAGSYCEQCSKTTVRGYGHQHQRRARLAIAESPRCAICDTSSDLTADHVVPLAAGGHPLGQLRTLCRRCNARRGARGSP